MSLFKFQTAFVQHRWPGHLTNTFNPQTVNQTFQSNSLYRRLHDLSHGHGFRNRSRYKFATKHHAPTLIARKANLSACKRCHKRGVAEKFSFNTKRTPVPSARTDETPLCVDTVRITQYWLLLEHYWDCRMTVGTAHMLFQSIVDL